MSAPTMSPPTSGEPRLAATASWAVLAASFGLSAATWIAMARLAGFSNTLFLPWANVIVDLAWLLPVAVDGYVVVALVLWMAPVPAKVAGFARINTYAATGIGVAAQSAYHALTVWSQQSIADHAVWQPVLAAVVGALPPAVAGLAVHMRALIRRESRPHTPAPTNTIRPTVAASLTPTAPQPVLTHPAPPVVQPVRPVAEPVSATPVSPAPVAVPALVPATTPTFTRRGATPLTREVTR